MEREANGFSQRYLGCIHRFLLSCSLSDYPVIYNYEETIRPSPFSIYTPSLQP